eukprot:CAMPEP_0114270640 /NCGR_PEP_ID=MMETSP0058-20121206/27361_1 /TAXON_ID=36894 /ORGANISM="Pyramimonas parkeae, CCMP726" /LENGTH=64 /DNA_ID=CAMNT_0001389421 /DNA_START=414 /DNA_END=608 /DNA_ORIENTATION=+
MVVQNMGGLRQRQGVVCVGILLFKGLLHSVGQDAHVVVSVALHAAVHREGIGVALDKQPRRLCA